MSLAKQLIGEPAPKAESNPVPEAKECVSAKDLIDTLAEQEFGLPESSAVSSTTVNTAAVSKKGKKDKGKVCAKAPGKVSYGKK